VSTWAIVRGSFERALCSLGGYANLGPSWRSVCGARRRLGDQVPAACSGARSVAARTGPLSGCLVGDGGPGVMRDQDLRPGHGQRALPGGIGQAQHRTSARRMARNPGRRIAYSRSRSASSRSTSIFGTCRDQVRSHCSMASPKKAASASVMLTPSSRISAS